MFRTLLILVCLSGICSADTMSLDFTDQGGNSGKLLVMYPAGGGAASMAELVWDAAPPDGAYGFDPSPAGTVDPVAGAFDITLDTRYGDLTTVQSDFSSLGPNGFAALRRGDDPMAGDLVTFAELWEGDNLLSMGSFEVDSISFTPVSEPSSVWIFAVLGFAALGIMRAIR